MICRLYRSMKQNSFGKKSNFICHYYIYGYNNLKVLCYLKWIQLSYHFNLQKKGSCSLIMVTRIRLLAPIEIGASWTAWCRRNSCGCGFCREIDSETRVSNVDWWTVVQLFRWRIGKIVLTESRFNTVERVILWASVEGILGIGFTIVPLTHFDYRSCFNPWRG